MSARGLATAISVGGCLALAGCGPSPAAGIASSSASVGATASLFAKASDVGTLRYTATRRYVAFTGAAPGYYVERFTCASPTSSSVTPLSMNGVFPEDMDQDQKRQFVQLAANMSGGGGRFIAYDRDFQVRDPALFAANYTFVPMGEAVIAGRSAFIAEVKPVYLDRPSYTVWADKANLLTLKYREYLPSGALAAEMETLEIAFGPKGQESVKDPEGVTDLTGIQATQAAGLLPAQVYEPGYLPAGFALESVRYARLAGFPAVAWTWSDGVQAIHCTEYAPLQSPKVAPAGYPANAPLSIGINLFGAYLKTTFEVQQTAFQVQGKVEPQELMTVIESLAPQGV